MKPLPHVAALCALTQAYLPEQESQPWFNAAMHELTQYHLLQTPGYASWVAASGVDVQALGDDWHRLPPLYAAYFKQYLPRSREVLQTTELHSSGTSGQKSHMHYDTDALQALMHMSNRIFAHYGWDRPQQRCNYLLFAYEANAAMQASGSARTDEFLCTYAPAARVVHALRSNGQMGHEFDIHGVIRALHEFAEEGLPVRIFGFPAFLWFVLERMRVVGAAPLKLHAESLVLTGGGWKTHAALEIDKQVFRRRIQDQLGIAGERCRDGYGAVEHGVPYIECAQHRFHVPSYARAVVRDVADMRLLDYGEPGLLHLMSPYIRSSPAHSMVLGDLAVLLPPGQCTCAIPTASFQVLGRAAPGKHRNCAIAASELIK
ncbi:acyl-protein synthase [Herbaspirillum sp. YR522]|uniref:LuxE/PaaK family acyltransferase n=1 Tax=Herbaspirillum sp. YR522 TaxID=1144342 RepID=UPI00026F5406|nr:acyl-protein synthase [Herbaspirillum sp. YR522]EJM97490.1 Acyl-protein synthetase, LuxE [Herbaspirillum sp. YR522]